MNKKNFVVISGAAAVLLALIACLGDSNNVIYIPFVFVCLNSEPQKCPRTGNRQHGNGHAPKQFNR